MIGYVYITTNIVNGKQYIGCHKSNSFDESYKGSGKLLKQAIEKYGWDNFECHILESINNIPTVCDSEDQLYLSEKYYIDYYNCINENNWYNLKEGGSGGSSPGYICITSQDGFHKRVSSDELDFYLKTGWYKKGPIPSEITKLKRAASNTGKKRSLETKRNISNSLIGKKYGPLSESHRKKISEVGKVNQPSMKRIRCVETGEEFFSLGEASRKYNISTSNICNNLKGKRLKAGKNLSFEYMD